MDLLVQGLTNRRIASALGMTEKTASVHVSHILTKLSVGSRARPSLAPTRSVSPARRSTRVTSLLARIGQIHQLRVAIHTQHLELVVRHRCTDHLAVPAQRKTLLDTQPVFGE